MLTADAIFAAHGWEDGLAVTGQSPTVRFVPTTVKRPRLVAEALRGQFGIDVVASERAVARIYGFPSWRELVSAVERIRGGRGDPCDEDSDAITVRARRDHHAKVLQEEGGLDPITAAAAAACLRPTSREGKPSLRNLDWEVARRVRLGEAMDEIGIDPGDDPLRALEDGRSAETASAATWLSVLKDDFGWKLSGEMPDAKGERTLIAHAVGRRGLLVPIYLTGLPIDPCDISDTRAEAIRRSISECHDVAFLLFDQILAWQPPPQARSGNSLLYGGQLLHVGEWSHFTLRPLRPGAGLYDAVDQHGLLHTGVPSEAFLDEFGAPDRLALATRIARKFEGPIAEERRPVMLPASVSHWVAPKFVSPDLARSSPGEDKEGSVGTCGSPRHPANAQQQPDPVRASGGFVPIASNEMHPVRWMRSVPCARQLSRLAYRAPQNVAEAEKIFFSVLDAVSNVLPHAKSLRNAEEEAVLFEEAMLAQSVIEFGRSGRNVFAFGHDLMSLLAMTDIEGMLIGDLVLPFPCFHIAFEGGLDASLSGPPNRIDGAYVLQVPENNSITVTLTSRLLRPEAWPQGREPSVRLTVFFDDVGVTLDDAIERSIAAFAQDSRDSVLHHGENTSAMGAAIVSRLMAHKDGCRVGIAMVLNAICYLAATDAELDERVGFPADAPEALVGGFERGSPKQKRKAQAALLEGGFVAVRMRGASVVRRPGEPGHGRGGGDRTVSPHWRRGHYRRQFDKDHRVKKLSLIPPTIVNAAHYDPAHMPGHIYLPPEPPPDKPLLQR